jgi:hypothetical protein
MSTTAFDTAWEKVKELAANFQAHKDRYLSPDYKEADVRLDFIDPFLDALGWKRGQNPYQQELKVERHAQSGTQGRADYAFYIAPRCSDGDERFFLEAKKPHDNIATAAKYFQTISYGYSSRTPLAVLTDFEQFHILDCRSEPKLKTALDHCVDKFDYTDYLDRDKFGKIYWLFSREAFTSGSFDATVKQLRGKKTLRAPKPVDESLLERLDELRIALAHAFKKNNPGLDSEALTEFSQRTLDRLVFLRFLEDKGIERQGAVTKLAGSATAWRDFIARCRQLDSIYNGIIYRQQPTLDAPTFRMDNAAFAEVCKRLAHGDSDYNFNFDFIPIHVLGSIYERFLGKVIVATDKRVRVEDKPEVRKAGGVYYTPDYIVHYIVENTVGKLIAGKPPDQIAEMRFADIACGSGSFLLGVYDLLLTYHGTWYNANPGKARKGDCFEHDGKLYLSLAKKRDILVKNIYGVDIDFQAVEVCQLSLCLKLLKDESPETTAQYLLDFEHTAQMKKLLPDLSKNIICGNSLIGRDIVEGQLFASDEERKLNPMNFEDAFPQIFRCPPGVVREPATPYGLGNEGGRRWYPDTPDKWGGFDAIVGNPPYDVMEKERGASSWPHTALSDYVRVRKDYEAALGGKLNLFRFFIVQSLSLLRSEGRLGMIVPLALLADISCAKTRQHLLMSTSGLLADCFPQKDNPSRRVFLTAKLSTVVLSGSKATANTLDSARIHVRVYPGNSFSDPYRECRVRLSDTKLLDPENTPIPLVDESAWELCCRIHRSSKVKRLGEVKDFNVTRGEINQTIYREYITTDRKMARLLKGVEVGQYELHKELQQGHREWFDECRFLRRETPKPIIQQHRIATQRITGVDERLRVVATMMKPPAYFADSTNSVTLSAPSPYRLEYLLAVLNSRFTQWRFKLTSTNNNVGTNELESLPFRVINFSDAIEKSSHDTVVAKVEAMLAAKKELARAKTYKDKTYCENKCAALDRQIDRLVYDLYGLTEAEIAIVEAAVT